MESKQFNKLSKITNYAGWVTLILIFLLSNLAIIFLILTILFWSAKLVFDHLFLREFEKEDPVSAINLKLKKLKYALIVWFVGGLIYIIMSLTKFSIYDGIAVIVVIIALIVFTFFYKKNLNKLETYKSQNQNTPIQQQTQNSPPPVQ
ncbi:hypothetical protein HN865_01655 [Candidatus Woesearchaeota archaeon]|jgi:hypothetical protein|nr:hypothetical protein [Candidatus Woesearchaeota archaeon]